MIVLFKINQFSDISSCPNSEESIALNNAPSLLSVTNSPPIIH